MGDLHQLFLTRSFKFCSEEASLYQALQDAPDLRGLIGVSNKLLPGDPSPRITLSGLDELKEKSAGE